LNFITKNSQSKLIKIIGIILFLVLIYFPVFMHLGSFPVGQWDESLFALRALYSHDTGEYLINFNRFQGIGDHMSTKLPFTTVFQVLGLKIFGVNELGIRLPIAFLFLGMAFYIIYLFKKHFNTLFIGVLFLFLLIVNLNFIGEHMLRTGNQDVPFAMYIVLATVFFYFYNLNGNWKNLLLFCFFITASLLTKNLLALIIFPGLGLYTLSSKERRRTVLLNSKTYFGIALVILCYILTIFYYNYNYPGFFQRMWEYELMGRYSNTIENHLEPFTYYISRYFDASSYGMSYLIFIGVIAYFDPKVKKSYRNILLLLILTFLSYLLVISNSATKTQWYDAPLYPLGALISAVGIHHFIYHRFRETTLVKTIITISAVSLVFFNYLLAFDFAYKPKANHKDQFYGEYIKKNKDLLTKDFTILDSRFFTAIYFETEKLNRNHYYNIQLTKYMDSISLPSRILTCEHIDQIFIEENTVFKLLDDEYGHCKTYLVEKVIIEE